LPFDFGRGESHGLAQPSETYVEISAILGGCVDEKEVLCKFLCHNIVVVHQSAIEPGIDTQFWEPETP